MGTKKDLSAETVEAAPPPVPQVTGRFLPQATIDRVIDLCRHEMRIDPGGAGRVAALVMADLGLS